MELATFGLGVLYIVLAAFEFWSLVKHTDLIATIERYKDALMVGIGTAYIVHSGIVDAFLGGVITH